MSTHSVNTEFNQASRAWRSIIGETYFPLNVDFRRSNTFAGQVNSRQCGVINLSRLTTDPICYERNRLQVRDAGDEEFIVSIPTESPVEYEQFGKSVVTRPGGFVIQRSDAPYLFGHVERNDIFALKVKRRDLGAFLRDPDRHAVRSIDAREGATGLFVEMVKTAHVAAGDLGAQASTLLGNQLLELLSVALTEKGDVLSDVASVRSAQLNRARTYIRQRLHDADLTPLEIAEACGISVRYLHYLFKDTGQTVGEFIRESRLRLAKEHLQQSKSVSISATAYKFGFSDHSAFSRAFKSKFGISPRQL